MGAQGGAAGVKKGRAGNLGVRARGESRGNLGRALRLCGEDGAGSWARTVSGFGQRATLAGGTGGSGRTTRGAGDAGLLRDVDRRGRPGRWVLGWIRGKGSGPGRSGFGPDEGEVGLGRTGERGGLRVGFCLGPVWLWVCFSFSISISILFLTQAQLFEFKRKFEFKLL
jgi:hypothetical protein